jgi:glycosyltransferase involved in cell wall biosynthesis
VIPNGIDLKPFRDTDTKKTPRPSLLFLGEVSERKGIYDLLKAVLLLKSKGYNYDVNVVGPGEIFVARDFIEKLDIEDNVSFAGPLRGMDKIEAFSRAWCFVLPSYAEGMPISIIEAFAAGLPVISTTVGGIPELVTDGINGYICEPGDVDTMASKLALIMERSKVRNRIGKTNRDKVQVEFSMEVCADRVAAVYNDLLGA